MFAEIVIEHRGKEKDRSSICCGRIFQTVIAGYYHFKIDVIIILPVCTDCTGKCAISNCRLDIEGTCVVNYPNDDSI
ncbi:hypothetical protein T07_8927 [Trichinella nelsoni]|uniref:Uncharacterized protein n=1 Tax=Trichinella nelsoni TaxID=6336 RepID=A0A0V0RV83_9BILA|nr:hypothetical protein T07_8927 [Trichinella nelsoni]